MPEAILRLPAPARWVLRRVVDPRHRLAVTADVAELFAIRRRTLGPWRAGWWAVRDALSVSRTEYGVRRRQRRNRKENLMHFLRDLRHAGRALVRNSGFAAVVIATLALAIGANTVIFSVVDGVLLRPLPYDDPGSIVVVQQVSAEEGGEDTPNGASQGLFLAWRESGRAFESLAMYSLESTTLTSLDEPVRLNGVAISPAGFTVLRARPEVGQVFPPDAELPGNDAVVLFSHRAWQRYWGGDPDLVGSVVDLDGTPRTVLGVMPAGFAFPDASVDYWVPMLATPPESVSIAVGADQDAEQPERPPQGQQRVERREGGPGGPDGADGPEGGPGPEQHMELWGRVVGRLADGVTPATAMAEGTTLLDGMRSLGPDGTAQRADVVPMQEQVVGSVRGPLLMLMGAVGFVLLIACANIANLVLARSIEHRRETAVRAAVGAGLGSLVRYSLAESLLLCGLGGAAGVALAAGGLRLLGALGPEFIPRLDEVGMDLRVLAFTVLVTVATTVLFGLLPARGAARLDLNRALKDDFGGGGAGGRSGLRRLLVTAEMTLAVVLLVGAGLLVSSFVRLTSVEAGYDPENLLHLNISLPATAYPDAESHLSFYDALVRRLESAPGVRSATVANRPPYAPANVRVAIDRRSETEAPDPDERPVPIGVRLVENGYFDTLVSPVAAGRALRRDDVAGDRPIAVLSASGAAAMFGEEDPVGQEMDFIGGQRLEIVGVMEDARTAGVDPTPQADIFLPYRQAPAQMIPMLFRTAEVFVRTEGAPLSALPTVRDLVRELDSQVVLISASTVRDQLADSVAEPRFYATLVAAFALLSLTLAAVGIYGMLAYVVQQGVRDTAIRRALGAPVGEILGRVMREGMVLAVVGLGLGIAGALALGRTLESMLYEIEATDPASYVAVAVVFLTVAALAVWIPARRAIRVDPMDVLRCE